MVLFPRKTKFKKFRKFKYRFNKIENRYNTPKVGFYGLKLIEGGRLTMQQLESVRKEIQK